MRPRLGKAIAGGFVGTLVMTMMMYFAAPMMGMPKMDIAASLGGMLGVGWFGGLVMHVFNGAVIFPSIYAYILYRALPGAPLFRGTLWGFVLWLLAQAMVMPMTGAGFFSVHMGGAMAAIASLVGHLTYGALLGAFAGKAEAGVADPEARPHAA